MVLTLFFAELSQAYNAQNLGTTTA